MGNEKIAPQDDIPMWTLVWTYWGYICGIIFAHLRKLTGWFSILLGWAQEDPAFLRIAVRLIPQASFLANN